MAGVFAPEEKMNYRVAFCNVVRMFSEEMMDEVEGERGQDTDINKLEWYAQGLGLCCKADSLVTRAMSDSMGAMSNADHAVGLYGRVRAKYAPVEEWPDCLEWFAVLQSYAERTAGR